MCRPCCGRTRRRAVAVIAHDALAAWRPPPPLDRLRLPFAPAAPWIAPGTPGVDGLTQACRIRARARGGGARSGAAVVGREARSLGRVADRHARSAAALPERTARERERAGPATKQAAVPRQLDFSARGRPNASTSGRGGSGTTAMAATLRRRGATPPRRPPRRSARAGVAADDGAAASAAAAVGAAESWWPPARRAGEHAVAREHAATDAGAPPLIRSEPSLSFPAWYPTAARLALWPQARACRRRRRRAHRPLRAAVDGRGRRRHALGRTRGAVGGCLARAPRAMSEGAAARGVGGRRARGGA